MIFVLLMKFIFVYQSDHKIATMKSKLILIPFVLYQISFARSENTNLVASIIYNIESNILKNPEPGWYKIELEPYIQINTKYHNLYNNTEGFSQKININIPEYNIEYQIDQSFIEQKDGSLKFEHAHNQNCVFTNCESLKSSSSLLIDVTRMALKIAFKDELVFKNKTLRSKNADFDFVLAEIKSGRNTAVTIKESGNFNMLNFVQLTPVSYRAL